MSKQYIENYWLCTHLGNSTKKLFYWKKKHEELHPIVELHRILLEIRRIISSGSSLYLCISYSLRLMRRIAALNSFLSASQKRKSVTPCFLVDLEGNFNGWSSYHYHYCTCSSPLICLTVSLSCCSRHTFFLKWFLL